VFQEKIEHALGQQRLTAPAFDLPHASRIKKGLQFPAPATVAIPGSGFGDAFLSRNDLISTLGGFWPNSEIENDGTMAAGVAASMGSV
jgi:hypothetical protein